MASIGKRPDGVWRARYRDGGGREHARHFKRKVDAQRWIDEVTASIVTGAYVDPRAGKVTFDSYFAEWASRQIWAPMTEVQNDLVRRSVPFGNMPMASIRRSHLEEWVRAMTTVYAPTTIATRVNVVRAALKAAVVDRVIATDPSPGLRLPRRRRPEAAMELPGIAMVAALLNAAEDRMRAYIGVCAFAGLRLGEASGLKVSDIDFSDGRSTSNAKYNDGAGVQQRFGRRSTDRSGPSSFRTGARLLAVHVERHGAASEGWLFFTGDGRPLPPTTVNSWWKRTASPEAAEVDGVHLHGLRHFYASGLIADGCDVVTVQRALGHRSATVTLNTYAHLWPTAEDRTRSAASNLAALVLGTAADSA